MKVDLFLVFGIASYVVGGLALLAAVLLWMGVAP